VQFDFTHPSFCLWVFIQEGFPEDSIQEQIFFSWRPKFSRICLKMMLYNKLLIIRHYLLIFEISLLVVCLHKQQNVILKKYVVDKIQIPTGQTVKAMQLFIHLLLTQWRIGWGKNCLCVNVFSKHTEKGLNIAETLFTMNNGNIHLPPLYYLHC